MSRLRLPALVALALSVTLTLPALGQAASAKHPHKAKHKHGHKHGHKPKKANRQQLYVSLGDSYAVGYQPTAPHVGSSTTNGYANQLLPLAKRKGYAFKLVNFGCGGATTTSILQKPGCDPQSRAVNGPPYTATQADAAVAYIKAHRKQVGLITVSIGGNDVTACAAQPDPIPCVGAAITSIKTNVSDLAQRLRAAAGPKVPIVGTTYPDVILGDWVLGNQQLAQLSVVAFEQLINPALKESYASANGGFVDVTAATGAYTPLDQTTATPDWGTVPVAVAKVCDLTYFCQFQDIHAKTAGYGVIAQLIADTLPRKR
jgi:lysophospholipase L1-like esterase